jgi:hypothetical protein
MHHDRAPVCGHVGDRPLVVPVHLARQAAAPRARHRPARGPRPDHDHAVPVGHILDDQGRQSGEHDSRQFTDVTRATKKKDKPEPAEQKAAEELVRRAREQGLSLTDPDGLLKQLTKTVLETVLNQEMTGHLGHEKHGQPAAGNVRNGTRSKTVLTESAGQVPVEVPRDRHGTFEPQIVKKRQRRLTGVDEMV